MERMENRRGVVSVDLGTTEQMKKSIDYCMRLKSDQQEMGKVNQAISDGWDTSKEFEEELTESASIQEINWYVEALQDAVTSICDEEEENHNRILTMMV